VHFSRSDTLRTFDGLLSIRKLEQSQKEKCFVRLEKIYCLFGGYDYDAAQKEAEDFFNGIYQTDSAYLSLTLEGGSNPNYLIGESSSLSDIISEEAIIRGITNLTNLQLIISHSDVNGKTKRFPLILPDSSIKIMKEGRPGQMVLGKWKAECIGLPSHGLPERIRLCIKWEAPILQHHRTGTYSDETNESLQLP